MCAVFVCPLQELMVGSVADVMYGKNGSQGRKLGLMEVLKVCTHTHTHAHTDTHTHTHTHTHAGTHTDAPTNTYLN